MAAFSISAITLASAAVSVLAFGDTSWVYSESGALMAAACALLWTGYLFEHRLEVSNAELYEEGFELAAYCLILASAAMTEKISGSAPAGGAGRAA